MNETVQKAIDAITMRQPKERGPVWMAGEQLKDILRAAPELAPIVVEDLAADKDALMHCEGKIRAFAKTHGGCCTPDEAERIIREHFGLPSAGEPTPQGDTAEQDGGLVSLDSFF